MSAFGIEKISTAVRPGQVPVCRPWSGHFPPEIMILSHLFKSSFCCSHLLLVHSEVFYLSGGSSTHYFLEVGG